MKYNGGLVGGDQGEQSLRHMLGKENTRKYPVLWIVAFRVTLRPSF